MKRYRLFCILLCIVLSTSACCQYRQDVALCENYELEYGMTPKEMENALGTPIQVDTSMAVTPLSVYLFEGTLLDHPAQIWCYFYDDSFLSQLTIIWQTEYEDEAQQLVQQAEQIVIEKYKDHKDFYWNQPDYSDADYSVIVGTNDGAAGILYSISRTGSEVSVICTDQC